MIFISAALVLVAIVLLVAGVVLGKVFLVMWSIVVSVLSAVCLLIGALLRRHELFPSGGRSVPEEREAAPAHAGAGPGTAGPVPVAAAMLPQAAPVVPPRVIPGSPVGPGARPPAGGLSAESIVLVIPGRKRFHLRGCRQLLGRQHEELTYEEAREEGFTPCTTCQPEGSARLAPDPVSGAPQREPSLDAPQAGTVAFPVYGKAGDPASGPAEPDDAVSGRAGSPPHATGTSRSEGSERPDRSAAAGQKMSWFDKPARTEPADDSDADTGPVRRVESAGPLRPSSGTGRAEAADRKTPAAETSAEAEEAVRDAAPAAKGTTVRVISGTRRFHTTDCPLLKGADDSGIETMSQAQAEAAGFGQCSICHTGP